MPGVLESSPASLDEMFLCFFFFPGREKMLLSVLPYFVAAVFTLCMAIPIDHFKCFKSFDYLESSIIL